MTEEQFYEKIPEWIKKSIEEWNHITLLAYFCYKYEQVNDVRFKLVRSKNGPASSKESRDFAKLFKLLAPEDYENLSIEKKREERVKVNKKIGHYINWMFDYRFKQTGKPINGTQTFLSPSIINEFERMFSKKISEKKNKSVFDELLVWVQCELPEILNRHQLERVNDLNMIKSYFETYDLGEASAEYRLIDKSKQLGLL